MAQLRRQTLIAVSAITIVGCTQIWADNQPTLDVDIQLGSKFGEFKLNNNGPEVLLNSTIAVEQQQNGQWEKIPVSNLKLREVCKPEPVPKCFNLKKAGTIHPVPWTGNYCSSQCPTQCRLDGPVPAGTYRFVISSCDNQFTIHSPAFKKTD